MIQVVIVPIWKKGDEKAAVLESVDSVQKILKEAGIRVKVDDSELLTPGWKFNHYEMKVIACAFIVETLILCAHSVYDIDIVYFHHEIPYLY